VRGDRTTAGKDSKGAVSDEGPTAGRVQSKSPEVHIQSFFLTRACGIPAQETGTTISGKAVARAPDSYDREAGLFVSSPLKN